MSERKILKPGDKVKTLVPVKYALCGMTATLPSGLLAYVVVNHGRRLQIARYAEPPTGEWWVNREDVEEDT